jgi:hypothetical protein
MKNTNATRKSKAKDLSLIDSHSKGGSVVENLLIKGSFPRVAMMAGLAERCRWKSIRPIVFPRPPPIPMGLELFRIRKRSILRGLLDFADDGEDISRIAESPSLYLANPINHKIALAWLAKRHQLPPIGHTWHTFKSFVTHSFAS